MKAQRLVVAALVTAVAMPAFAADAEAEAPPATGDHHAELPPTIVVTALSRHRDDILSGTSILAGEELAEAKRSTIGETLARTPGASSSSFGPSAARPVLRGLQGDRVRVLTDGIGAFDASGTSVDHAVAINPLTAERIEVLRGPAALLYGSSAIGGVVNVIDSRIPVKVPSESVHLQADVSYATAAKERSAAGTIDVPIGEHLAVHADGSYLKSDDLRSGGFLLSAPLRAQATASGDPGVRDLATLRGRLSNTAARTWDAAAGIAYIDAGGSLGISYTHLDNFYGVPIRFSPDPAIEVEQPRISLRQDRFDLRGEVDAGGGFIDTVRLRAGFGDYTHQEIEPSGEVATTFLNKGMEGRIEFIQAKRGMWSGAFGGQILSRDFNVIGEEKFLPKNATEQGGLFALQQFDLGAIRAEFGGRIEKTLASAAEDADLGNPAITRRFTSYSGSAGASLGVAEGWRLGLNLTHSERAPTAEELFANGPHAGTQAFEIGLPDARREKSNGAEVTVNGRGGGYSLGLSVYYNRFSNFLYQAPTGDIEDDLPVYAIDQGSARLYGFEAQAELDLFTLPGAGTVSADALADYTRASMRGFGPAPLIPPLRLLGGLDYRSQAIDGRIEVEHVTRQDRVAPIETTTAAYTMVNASLSWKPFGTDGPLTLRVAGNNLLDQVARRHASLLKDYAPLAGRDLRLGVGIRF